MFSKYNSYYGTKKRIKDIKKYELKGTQYRI